MLQIICQSIVCGKTYVKVCGHKYAIVLYRIKKNP